MGRSGTQAKPPAALQSRPGAHTLALTPEGHVVLIPGSEGDELVSSDLLEPHFALGSARGVLGLASDLVDQPLAGAPGFWRDLGKAFLTAALREDSLRPGVPPGLVESTLLGAPPMRGGEYLSADVVQSLWTELSPAAASLLDGTGLDLASYLSTRCAAWRMVGKVCLSLAENRRHPDRPFAFLATYTARISSDGRAQHIPFARAVQEEARTGDNTALLAILAPLQRAASRSALLAELIATRKVFQPQAWTPAEALRFLRDVPALEECGILVRVPDWWSPKNPPRAKVSVSVGSRAPEGHLGLDAMLDFDVRLTLNGEAISEEEWHRLVEGTDGLAMIRGRWVEVDRERLAGVLEHWRDAQQAVQSEGLSFTAAMRLLVGAPSANREEQGEREADPVESQWSEVIAGPWLREALAGLRDPHRLAVVDPGAALTATLRPYQVAGVKWLWHLYQLRLGGCLADDMGLGKTIQVLALLLLVKAGRESSGPSLLVAPASLIGNWCAEAERFAPTLRLLVVHPTLGAKDLTEAKARATLGEVDLVVTSFGTVPRVPWLAKTTWNLVVLDEAQAIKNPSTQQTRAVKSLKACRRLALTGTPVENRLQDLWSIFDFVNPGLLGSAKQFAEVSRRASGEGAQAVYATLRGLVAPYILRRLKTDRRIIDDLPEKIELDVACNLTPQQAALYARTVASLEEDLKRADEGIQRRGLVLSYLTRFKQICNHPSQLTGDGIYAPGESGKLRRLRLLAEEIAARGEKLLVFTQYQTISTMLDEFLAAIYGRPGAVLTGSTPVKQRKILVDAFQRDGGPPFFVLSLKAGGTGLNLTAASQVVHFDRWWNPAVENQATDRAFRIGQTRRVTVHKFMCAGTIEERIDRMIKDKRKLASEILSGDQEIDLTSLSDTEIMKLVALDLRRATAGNEET